MVPTRGGAYDLTVTERLAALSHSLSNSALRVFIHFWARRVRDLSQSMYIITRKLSALAGCDPKSTRTVLDQLYACGAIALRWGDSSRPNRVYVSLWEGSVLSFQTAPAASEGGGKIPPPPGEDLPQVGENFRHVGKNSLTLSSKSRGVYLRIRPRLRIPIPIRIPILDQSPPRGSSPR